MHFSQISGVVLGIFSKMTWAQLFKTNDVVS